MHPCLLQDEEEDIVGKIEGPDDAQRRFGDGMKEARVLKNKDDKRDALENQKAGRVKEAAAEEGGAAADAGVGRRGGLQNQAVGRKEKRVVKEQEEMGEGEGKHRRNGILKKQVADDRYIDNSQLELR